jgi:hypothetical protein
VVEVSESKTADSITNPALDPEVEHPSGKAKYGRFRAFIRACSFGLYFAIGTLTYVF